MQEMNLSWNQLCGKGTVGVLKALEVSSGTKENWRCISGAGPPPVFRYKKMESIESHKNKEIFHDYKFTGTFSISMPEKMNTAVFRFFVLCEGSGVISVHVY